MDSLMTCHSVCWTRKLSGGTVHGTDANQLIKWSGNVEKDWINRWFWYIDLTARSYLFAAKKFVMKSCFRPQQMSSFPGSEPVASLSGRGGRVHILQQPKFIGSRVGPLLLFNLRVMSDTMAVWTFASVRRGGLEHHSWTKWPWRRF